VTNPKAYFNCRGAGHFITNCPYKKKTPPVFSNSVNGLKQMTRITHGASTKTKPSFGRAKVNHVYAEEAEDAPRVVLGEFLVQSFLATILFDSGASHSFIFSHFIEIHDIPTVALKRPLTTKPLGGHIPYHLGVINIPINLSGVVFPTSLVVLNSHGIDVIFGMDWLTKYQGTSPMRKEPSPSQTIEERPSLATSDQAYLTPPSIA
jgi:hypothetical protein